MLNWMTSNITGCIYGHNGTWDAFPRRLVVGDMMVRGIWWELHNVTGEVVTHFISFLFFLFPVPFLASVTGKVLQMCTTTGKDWSVHFCNLSISSQTCEYANVDWLGCLHDQIEPTKLQKILRNVWVKKICLIYEEFVCQTTVHSHRKRGGLSIALECSCSCLSSFEMYRAANSPFHFIAPTEKQISSPRSSNYQSEYL